MTSPLSIRLLPALLLLVLVALVPANAVAADTYEASWNGGHLIATANADFTEATIDSVSVSFDGCGTAPEEATCTWEAKAILYAGAKRCDPSAPETQIAWDSGPQAGNGTVEDGAKSFVLEGCRGQSLTFRLEFHKTYEEGGDPPPWRVTGGASIWGLFTFGYHPVEEEEQRIINASPPAHPSYPPFEPNFTPTKTFAVSLNCGSLSLNATRYAFAFHRMGCHKASNLARSTFLTGRAPSGYVCRHKGSVLCWRQGQPQKYFEWRRPGTPPAHV
ncbi:MAG: hypothetical protein ACTHLH_08925 [Solirubrobacterales bacterium]